MVRANVIVVDASPSNAWQDAGDRRYAGAAALARMYQSAADIAQTDQVAAVAYNTTAKLMSFWDDPAQVASQLESAVVTDSYSNTSSGLRMAIDLLANLPPPPAAPGSPPVTVQRIITFISDADPKPPPGAVNDGEALFASLAGKGIEFISVWYDGDGERPAFIPQDRNAPHPPFGHQAVVRGQGKSGVTLIPRKDTDLPNLARYIPARYRPGGIRYEADSAEAAPERDENTGFYYGERGMAADTFTFSGVAGQSAVVILDQPDEGSNGEPLPSEGFSPFAIIRSPEGELIDTITMESDVAEMYELSFPTTGEYTVMVWDDPRSTGYGYYNVLIDRPPPNELPPAPRCPPCSTSAAACRSRMAASPSSSMCRRT